MRSTLPQKVEGFQTQLLRTTATFKKRQPNSIYIYTPMPYLSIYIYTIHIWLTMPYLYEKHTHTHTHFFRPIYIHMSIPMSISTATQYPKGVPGLVPVLRSLGRRLAAGLRLRGRRFGALGARGRRARGSETTELRLLLKGI